MREILWRGGRLEAAALERDDLPHDDGQGGLTGPALVMDPGATTLVPPGWSAARDRHGHVHLCRMAS
jgi:N-methylhydantoinase A/oxoprolinase/acetone carboxylase beta subunit